MIFKNKLLVFASTFPRWKDDTIPGFVYELSKRLTKDFDVSVLAPSYPGAKDFEIMDKMNVYRFRYFFRKYETLAGSGGILPTLKKNKWFYFQVPFFLLGEYFALKKLIKKIKPDIIHAHWIIPQGFIASLIPRKYKVDYIVTTWGGDMFIFKRRGFLANILKKLYAFILNKAKYSTTVNSVFLSEMKSIMRNPSKLYYIPNGTDIEIFNPNKRDLSIKKKYEINGPFLLFVGRLTEKKGVRYLIEAMPEVVKRFLRAKLIIIGTGELERDLKDLTKKLNMENHIIFTGAILNKELPKYYATADIFIAPSIITEQGDREGFPTVFLESMSSGTPILTTNIDGIEDIIEDGKNGFIVNQKSSKEIAKKIIKILGHLSLFRKIKYSSRKCILNKYNLDIVSEQYFEVLR